MTYIPPSAKCNACGCIKGETNNWYMCELRESSIKIYQFDMNEVALGIPCLCGRECLQRFIEKNISVVYPPVEEGDAFENLNDDVTIYHATHPRGWENIGG